jgi:hypothetical protein
MYLWEMLAARLRRDGWLVWHKAEKARSEEPTYIVHLHRGGEAWRATGPTLTEAFAEAARKVKTRGGAPERPRGPHFQVGARAACV